MANGHGITSILCKMALAFAICVAATKTCYATSHAFVADETGEVWLVSDTLLSHSDGLHKTKYTICKVVIQRGRIIFNAGKFSSVPRLMDAEAAVPWEDFDLTATSVTKLLWQYRQEGDFQLDPRISDRMAGAIITINGEYTGGMFGDIDADRSFSEPVYEFIPGVPHGFGDYVEKMHRDAFTNPAIRDRIAKNPKEELLKILEKESIDNPDVTGPPYTIFLLHRDGTVSDYSQEHVCHIPPNAIHQDQPQSHR